MSEQTPGTIYISNKLAQHRHAILPTPPERGHVGRHRQPELSLGETALGLALHSGEHGLVVTASHLRNAVASGLPGAERDAASFIDLLTLPPDSPRPKNALGYADPSMTAIHRPSGRQVYGEHILQKLGEENPVLTPEDFAHPATQPAPQALRHPTDAQPQVPPAERHHPSYN